MVNKNILILLMSIILVSNIVFSTDDELRHHWGDETSGTTVADQSTYEIDATTGDSNMLNHAGKIINAVEIDDGTNKYTFPDSADIRFTPTTPFSIAFWYKKTTGTTDGATMFIDSSLLGTTGGKFMILAVQQADDTFKIGTYVSGTGFANDFQFADLGTLSDNVWYHVIMTYDGADNIKGYLNNGAEQTDTYTRGAASSHSEGYVFRQEVGHVFLIDDFRLMNYVISSDDRSTLYNSGTGTQSALNPPVLTAPFYDELVNNASSPLKNAMVYFNVTFQSETNLSVCDFAENQTGTLINVSTVFPSGNLSLLIFNLTVSDNLNKTVCGQVTCNNTAGLSNQTNLSCFDTLGTPEIPRFALKDNVFTIDEKGNVYANGTITGDDYITFTTPYFYSDYSSHKMIRNMIFNSELNIHNSAYLCARRGGTSTECLLYATIKSQQYIENRVIYEINNIKGKGKEERDSRRIEDKTMIKAIKNNCDETNRVNKLLESYLGAPNGTLRLSCYGDG